MSRNEAGRIFQNRGTATAKLLSLYWVLVRSTTQHMSAGVEKQWFFKIRNLFFFGFFGFYVFMVFMVFWFLGLSVETRKPKIA